MAWYVAKNIVWDADEEGIPTTIVITEDVTEGCETDDEVSDAISEYISDTTGWCHLGFDYEELEEYFS